MRRNPIDMHVSTCYAKGTIEYPQGCKCFAPNRETGESPVRSRRCKRRVVFKIHWLRLGRRTPQRRSSQKTCLHASALLTNEDLVGVHDHGFASYRPWRRVHLPVRVNARTCVRRWVLLRQKRRAYFRLIPLATRYGPHSRTGLFCATGGWDTRTSENTKIQQFAFLTGRPSNVTIVPTV